MRHRKSTAPRVLFRLDGLLPFLAAASGCLVTAAAPSEPPTGAPPAIAPKTGKTDPTPPASRPAPPTLPADASTPKDALKLFAAALRDGDADKLHAVVLTSEPAEGRMLGAMADLAAALTRLNHSAVKAFGETEAARLSDDTSGHFADTLARIDAAEVVLEGDKATVRYADARETPFELRKVNGLWKVPMNVLSPGAPAEVAALDRRLAEFTVQTRIVGELADEIAAGKYKTADAAKEAWRGRFMQTLPTRPPATGPAAPAPSQPPAPDAKPSTAPATSVGWTDEHAGSVNREG